MEKLNESAAKDLGAVRAKKPLIHHITNFVVMNETANITLCLGALPVMAHAVEEVEEMVSAAGALVLNIGTLWPELIHSMVVAAKRANELGIPVILDPVGAGATGLRTDSANRILSEVDISVIRANCAETAVLAGLAGEIKGVESVGSQGDVAEIARKLSSERDCVAVVTGREDVVSDGNRVAVVKNGDPMMATITGTGCMATTVVAGFAAVQEDSFRAAVGGLVTFGLAGEHAAQRSGEKPGTFHVALYDSLAAIDYDDIVTQAEVEAVNVGID